MRIDKMAKIVNNTAISAKANGQTIEINYRLPYIAIDNNNGDSYFFQGQEADELIEENRLSKLHTYCSLENIILWLSQSW